MLSVTEETVIRNVIAKLRGQSKTSDDVHEALTTGTAKCFLDSWVVGALECLLPEGRDPQLALSLSDYSPREGHTKINKHEVRDMRELTKTHGWSFREKRGRWFIWKMHDDDGRCFLVTDAEGYALSRDLPAHPIRYRSLVEARDAVDQLEK